MTQEAADTHWVETKWISFGDFACSLSLHYYFEAKKQKKAKRLSKKDDPIMVQIAPPVLTVVGYLL